MCKAKRNPSKDVLYVEVNSVTPEIIYLKYSKAPGAVKVTDENGLEAAHMRSPN